MEAERIKVMQCARLRERGRGRGTVQGEEERKDQRDGDTEMNKSWLAECLFKKAKQEEEGGRKG